MAIECYGSVPEETKVEGNAARLLQVAKEALTPAEQTAIAAISFVFANEAKSSERKVCVVSMVSLKP